ncbi:MAG: Rieske 2Fe-2S domain-containing protein [Candidatus Acidiferrales bacterium]
MRPEKTNGHRTRWTLALLGATATWLMRNTFMKKAAARPPEMAARPPGIGEHAPAPVVFSYGENLAEAIPGSRVEGREDVGTLFVLCALLIALGATVGFVVVYWIGAPHMLLGGMAALSMGSFGCGLVLWAHWLTEDEQVIQPREELLSPQPEREEAAADFRADRRIQRRNLLIGLSTGVIAAFAAAMVSMFRSFSISPALPSLKPTIWRAGDRLVTMDGNPVSLNSLNVGSAIGVFPENRIAMENSQVVLVRVRQELLRLPKSRATWAPGGYLAYSRVCTHAGCSVGMYQAETCLLQCPCHQSTFDALAAAKPTGGPAARSLPQLPLYVDKEGNLRAGGDFTEPPGPGFWGLT